MDTLPLTSDSTGPPSLRQMHMHQGTAAAGGRGGKPQYDTRQLDVAQEAVEGDVIQFLYR